MRKQRKLANYVFEGFEIEGLRRRPDGRFYSAIEPTRTFGSEPREAVTKYSAWASEVVTGSRPAPGFLFWRNAFRRLLLKSPQVAAKVLGVKALAQLVPYDYRNYDELGLDDALFVVWGDLEPDPLNDA